MHQHTDHDEDAATILFLAANPMANAALDQGEEYRAIENRIRAATYSPRIRLRPRLAARPDDLLDALLRDTPAVLHFSGHGGGHVGLCFRGDDGRTASVSADGLAQVMLVAGETIKLVVLNACYSEVQARALVAHVPCVIGTPGPIEDGAAISYAAAFYRALAYGRSVANAHQNGKAALALHASAGQTRDVELADIALRTPHPTLLTRQDVDAERIHLVALRDGPPRAAQGGDLSTVQLEIVLDAKLGTVTPEIVARMVSELSRLGGGHRVRILFVTSGSVRLTLAAPRTAVRAIADRWTGGELPRLGDLRVIDVIEQGDISVAFELAQGRSAAETQAADARGEKHDVVIVHADADEPLVQGYLLPALAPDGKRVLLVNSRCELDARSLKKSLSPGGVAIVLMSYHSWGSTVISGLLSEQAGIEHADRHRVLAVLLDDSWPAFRYPRNDTVDLRDRSRDTYTRQALRLRSIHVTSVQEPDVSRACPYPGMRPFSEHDEAQFFGREHEIQEILERIGHGERELYVIGSRHVGKSSLIAAGVLPRWIRTGDESRRPFVCTVLPGDHPIVRIPEPCNRSVAQGVLGVTTLQQLSQALAELLESPIESLLVFVDQLEDLFAADAQDLAKFVSVLRALRADRRCTLVFALRAECFGAFINSELWHDSAGARSRIELAPLATDALRAAICRPAQQIGVHLDPTLIERLIVDTAHVPGALPLLQFALQELWARRCMQFLPLFAYNDLQGGSDFGLVPVLARYADAAISDLPTAGQEVALRLLLDLTYVDKDGVHARTRRRLDEIRRLPRVDMNDADLVLGQLIDTRLIVPTCDGAGDLHVELAHEVLITAWPRFARHIERCRNHQQRVRDLEVAAQRWRLQNTRHAPRMRRSESVDDPAPGLFAAAWLGDTDLSGLSSDAVAFLAAARSPKRRRARIAPALAAGFAIAALFLGINAWSSARRAAAKHREHDQLLAEWSRFSEETGRRRLVDDNRPLEALPYLVAARETIEASGGRPAPSLRLLFGEAVQGLPLSEPLAHDASVVSAVFSPDGRRIATASDDHTARIWTGYPLPGAGITATDRLSALTLSHRQGVSSVAFSPDSGRVLTASNDHTAYVWSAVTGQRVAGPLTHLDAVNDAEFSSDGTRVVTASSDRTARIWDAATGQPLSPPLEHADAVHSAVFSPDGTLVVTTSDNTAQVWSTVSHRRKFSPLTHQGVIYSAIFSANGCCIVTASEDHTAQVWDAATGKPLSAPLRHGGAIRRAMFSADSTRVVTASDDHTARVWSASSGEPISPPLVHADAVRSAAFSPDGRLVVTASNDHTARIWDGTSGALLSTSFRHLASVRAVAFSADGTELVTASDDHTARVWQATRLPPALQHDKPIQSAVFSPDATRVVTASWDHTARVWDARSRRAISPPLRHEDALQGAVFSPDGTRVATASWDRTARVWDAVSGAAITPPLVHDDAVVSVVFSPDGARVVTASWDHTARVWDAQSGRPLTPPLQHAGAIYMASFSPSGTRIVTASSDDTARVWDAATGKPLSPPLTHLDGVRFAAFSPDGTRVVTASSDHTARVWDALTGAPVSPPLAHQGPVDSAAFDPSGRRVVTASRDHDARIWDAVSGTLVAGPLHHNGGVWSAVFSSDGTRVLTASQDGTARIWDAVSGQPLSAALVHRGPVWSAAFRPDGGAVLTASDDSTARIWELPRAPATLAEWQTIANRVSPYVLVNGVLSIRSDARSGAAGFTEMGE